MALNKSQLAQLLKTTFQSAKDNAWSSDQVADALADAINTFVLTADVTGVQVSVVNTNNVNIGTGTQTGTGKLQ
jgi:phosphoenolpyruvate carboxylase